MTEEPFLVFAANAFALLGLRAMLVKGLLDRLVYLSLGLSIILGFIGIKLILHRAHVDIDERVPEIPTLTSLVVILVILTIVTRAAGQDSPPDNRDQSDMRNGTSGNPRTSSVAEPGSA